AQYVSPVYPKMENVEPVAQAITIPATVTVNAESPWKTLDEFISYAKANPGKIRSSNSGIGASAHIYSIVFEEKVGIEFNHIPYPAYAEAVVALLGGHVDSTNIPLPDVAPHIQSGKLRMLAIASDERHIDFPDVPTLKELGIDIVMGNYSGFVAPKGMAKEQIKVLEEGIGMAMQDPEIRKFLIGAGFQPVYLNAANIVPTALNIIARTNNTIKEFFILFVFIFTPPFFYFFLLFFYYYTIMLYSIINHLLLAYLILPSKGRIQA
ncbi:unnamed protein product, partial [marine sediment metagenome]